MKVWNEHDAEGWVGDFAATARVSGPGASGTGVEMASAFYSVWQDAFPDARIRDERILEDGDTGTLQAVFTGTHTATMNAPDQVIPATGRSVSLPFVVISRYESGKVVEFGLSSGAPS